MEFKIKNRCTGAVQFTADIKCAENASVSLKLGLAIRVAVKEKANLSGADLSGADLRGANLNGADLSGADLSGAYLRDANLRGANLRGAYLRDANLRGANLRGADLSDASLSDADLSEADLRGADLERADLRSADLSGEKVKRILASVQRVSDGYTFILWDMEVGPPKIVAGCRFLTCADYAAHVADKYPYTAKARETLRILDYFSTTVAAENSK